jgi:hypothetical protein
MLACLDLLKENSEAVDENCTLLASACIFEFLACPARFERATWALGKYWSIYVVTLGATRPSLLQLVQPPPSFSYKQSNAMS